MGDEIASSSEVGVVERRLSTESSAGDEMPLVEEMVEMAQSACRKKLWAMDEEETFVRRASVETLVDSSKLPGGKIESFGTTVSSPMRRTERMISPEATVVTAPVLEFQWIHFSSNFPPDLVRYAVNIIVSDMQYRSLVQSKPTSLLLTSTFLSDLASHILHQHGSALADISNFGAAPPSPSGRPDLRSYTALSCTAQVLGMDVGCLAFREGVAAEVFGRFFGDDGGWDAFGRNRLEMVGLRFVERLGVDEAKELTPFGIGTRKFGESIDLLRGGWEAGGRDKTGFYVLAVRKKNVLKELRGIVGKALPAWYLLSSFPFYRKTITWLHPGR
ncbi:hypothetical protein BC829DRAFT_397611 [Chytridium lagenaria]|nr:hypothetical protein BC829DRAFT_397611 [Chytridium lagenaria]